MNIALAHFCKCGKFNPAVREWEARPIAFQTWDNLKIMMSIEYAKTKRQDATTAAAVDYGSANATIDDYIMVMEGLVANLTKEQNKKMDATAKQLEALVASITAMTAAFKGTKATPKTTLATNAAAVTTAAPAANANCRAKQEAYRHRLLIAVTCTTAEGNIRQAAKTSVGNYLQTQLTAHPGGRRQRPLDGARGHQ